MSLCRQRLSYPSVTGGIFLLRGLLPDFFRIFGLFASGAGAVDVSVSEVPALARLRDAPGLPVVAGPELGAWPAELIGAEGIG